jgi:hypothetical protein
MIAHEDYAAPTIKMGLKFARAAGRDWVGLEALARAKCLILLTFLRFGRIDWSAA